MPPPSRDAAACRRSRGSVLCVLSSANIGLRSNVRSGASYAYDTRLREEMARRNKPGETLHYQPSWVACRWSSITGDRGTPLLPTRLPCLTDDVRMRGFTDEDRSGIGPRDAAVVVEPLEAESVPLEEALGRTLAQDIISTEDVPAFDKSAMDGYALRGRRDLRREPHGPGFLQGDWGGLPGRGGRPRGRARVKRFAS